MRTPTRSRPSRSRGDGRIDPDQPPVQRRRQPRPPRPGRHRPVPRRCQLRLRLGRRATGWRGRFAGRQEDLVTLKGEPGPHRTEQSVPHPHHCPFDPGGRFVVVPDKGLDRLFVFRLDAAKGVLVPGDPPSVKARSAPAPDTSPSTLGCRTPTSSTSSTRPSPRTVTRLPGCSTRCRFCPRFRRPSRATTRAPRSTSRRPGALFVYEQGTRQRRHFSRRRIHGAPVAGRVGTDEGRHAALHRPRPVGRAALLRESARRHRCGIRRRRGERRPECHGPHRRGRHTGVRGVEIGRSGGPWTRRAISSRCCWWRR